MWFFCAQWVGAHTRGDGLEREQTADFFGGGGRKAPVVKRTKNERSQMSHRHRKILHPDRGKRAMLGTALRKVIRAGGIFLTKVAEGALGAGRVLAGRDSDNRRDR